MLKVGDKVIRTPETFYGFDERDRKSMAGRVVYIHPEGRFHTVEFKCGTEKIRESYLGVKE